ncbi:hypothetical protein [Bifidobacterium sp. AGR2158]|uniref:hypothetical protein n=1 Tax=Bifidobacterium sp. AGR2158 TaxID=1280675 RepID=UPI00047DF518|nr:hypothetical protein [Bifidobacterium sp. AGR2158]
MKERGKRERVEEEGKGRKRKKKSEERAKEDVEEGQYVWIRVPHMLDGPAECICDFGVGKTGITAGVLGC